VCVEEVPKPRTELTGIPPAGRAYREAQNESVDPGRPSYRHTAKLASQKMMLLDLRNCHIAVIVS
jgi:hypothetical protein